jgi:hypothetical protein
MPLPLDSARCQGRTARAGGFATLCVECTDCQRRTDIPADHHVQYMPPPKMVHWWLGCPERVGPDDEVLVLE